MIAPHNGSDWGVCPVLFHLGNWPVPAYGFFVLLGLATGLALAVWEIARAPQRGPHAALLVLAALTGGIVGAKLPYLVYAIWRADPAATAWPAILSGRSILGGLLGGALGVQGMKRLLGVTGQKGWGDLLVLPLTAGLALGRWGCFLRGCCYGRPTCLPWGVDFGDGIGRHPTQLYESLWLTALFGMFCYLRRRPAAPGARWRLFMLLYFGSRLGWESLRAGPGTIGGLTGFQWLALAVTLYYAWQLFRLSKYGRLYPMHTQELIKARQALLGAGWVVAVQAVFMGGGLGLERLWNWPLTGVPTALGLTLALCAAAHWARRGALFLLLGALAAASLAPVILVFAIARPLAPYHPVGVAAALIWMLALLFLGWRAAHARIRRIQSPAFRIEYAPRPDEIHEP